MTGTHLRPFVASEYLRYIDRSLQAILRILLSVVVLRTETSALAIKSACMKRLDEGRLESLFILRFELGSVLAPEIFIFVRRIAPF